MIHWIYDIECLPNFFSITLLDANTSKDLIKTYVDDDINTRQLTKSYKALNPVVFEISERVNDLGKIVLFFQEKKYLVGYNNHNYDDWLVAHCINFYPVQKSKSYKDVTNALYKMSQKIIHEEEYVRNILWNDQYLKIAKSTFDSIDLMKLHYLDKYRVSLKQVAIHLKWYNILDYKATPPTEEEVFRYYGHRRVAEVLATNSFDRFVIDREIPHMMYYNFNDVLITFTLYHHGIKELVNRYEVRNIFGLDRLSASRSSLANALMIKFYSEKTGLDKREFLDTRTERFLIPFGQIISPKIRFKTARLRDALQQIQSTRFRVGYDKLNLDVDYRDSVYTFATGGLHSQDRPMYFKSDDKYIIRDADVNIVAS